jgi:lysophospholipase L1-like esterase
MAGWLRRDRRRTLLLVAFGLVFTEAVNLGFIMITAYTAPGKLRHVSSLQALVGGSPAPALPSGGASPPPGSKVVVIGDSTASGKGNLPVADPTATDRICNRSIDSYAHVLASANGWQVTNLACSGATIAAGLLGSQRAGSQVLSPQIDDPAVVTASTIIVSVGANDLHWTNILLVCAVSVSCDNNAEQAYFQQQLAEFSRNYLQLLTQLEALPSRPRVLINLYYAPLFASDSCLTPLGIDSGKRASLVSDLDIMNTLLAKGARAASFAAVKPNFSGHGLCSAQPYVQGVKALAPFHPTAAGQLAIALADEHALQGNAAN